MMTNITAEMARAVFDYAPMTGVLCWKQDRVSYLKSGNAVVRARAGEIAGSNHRGGYRVVPLNGKLFLAHRVCWLITHGCWPSGHIDHINGDRSDNRIINLRIATDVQNARNRGAQSNNKSGYKGVSWDKRENKWVARIKTDSKYLSLGYFSDVQEAANAYKAASLKFHGQFARIA